MRTASAWTYRGVACVSLCVLVVQLGLTRLFSATMYYHFAFLAISLALFGSAAGGVAVYAAERPLARLPTPRVLAALAALFGLTTVAALLVVLGSPLSPLQGIGATVLRLAAIYSACALPFFCAGCAVALAVSRHAADMGRLYLFDLGGAALGCLLLLPALDAWGAVDTLLASAVLAALAGPVFDAAAPGPRAFRAGLWGVALALCALLAANRAGGALDVRRAKGLDERGRVIFARWNSFSRVTVWGSLNDDSVLVLIDADAATPLLRDALAPARRAALAQRVEALAYRLRPGAKALVIGAGGGQEVAMARHLGAREVTAVELNPLIARAIVSAEPFRSWSGRLFEQPGVRLVVDEARSYIRASRERYDVIQATMVDTWAATAAGAFALSENSLYTVEAFRDYAGHLAPGGLLSLTRWYTLPPDQILRLVTITRAMMDERGVPDAARRIVLICGPAEGGGARAAATLLYKDEPFSDAELDVLESASSAAGLTPLYTPRARGEGVLARLIQAPSARAIYDGLPTDVSPTRDDRPFFFNTARPGGLRGLRKGADEWRKTNLGTFVLLALGALTALVCLLFIALPLVLRRGDAGHRPDVRGLSLFACLGLGFIVVEVVLVQKCILFLGHPSYALSVVLFTLLACGGFGSALSARVADERLPRALAWALATIALAAVAAVLGLSPLFAASVHLERAARVGVAFAALAPLGLALGTPMPLAVRLLARSDARALPWAWGVNGAASVTGSVAALVLALLWGFDTALLVGAAAYLSALALAARAPVAGATSAGSGA